MRTITYPSAEFREQAKTLISDRAAFRVVVPASSKQKQIVMRKLRNHFYREPEGRGSFARIFDTWRITEFLNALAGPLLRDGYGIKYADEADVVLEFTPKGGNSQSIP